MIKKRRIVLLLPLLLFLSGCGSKGVLGVVKNGGNALNILLTILGSWLFWVILVIALIVLVIIFISNTLGDNYRDGVRAQAAWLGAAAALKDKLSDNAIDVLNKHIEQGVPSPLFKPWRRK